MNRPRLMLTVRRYWAVLACIGLFMVFATAVGAYILDHVRFRWPWDEKVLIEAEFAHGQAISPGQGQAVTVAGVTVGQIVSVDLEGGVAILGLELEPEELGPVYQDATVVMRPRTLGQDQVIELDPGQPDPSQPDDGELEDGDRLDIAASQVNVNTDEVLGTLDADTREYLKLLLHAGAEGIGGRESDLRETFKLFEPTLSQVRRVSGALAGRRREVRALVTNLRRLSEATVQKDTELASLVEASSAVFGTIGEREAELAGAVARLPGALDATRDALQSGAVMADEAGPALNALRPAARRLGPALDATEPFIERAAPVLRDDFRPLVRAATPLFEELDPSLASLNETSPALIRTGELLNYTVNELGFNPDGPEEGYLFWTAWFAHNLASTLSVEDAHGAVIRGLVQVGCSTLPTAAENAPIFLPLIDAGVCP